MLESLESFNKRLEEAMKDLLYPWKDPKREGKIHYAYVDHILPLSVTPQEGDLLFRIMREFKPEHIIEAGTGTGVSAACMIGGWPTAKLATCDNFTEGKVGTEKGTKTCYELWSRLGIADNIKLFSIHMRDVPLNELVGDILFIDGTIRGAVQTELIRDTKVIIEHDVKKGHHPGKHALRFPTHCYLTVHSDDTELLERLSVIGGRIDTQG